MHVKYEQEMSYERENQTDTVFSFNYLTKVIFTYWISFFMSNTTVVQAIVYQTCGIQ
jgi:hypothetical protein